jgi:MFS family permease
VRRLPDGGWLLGLCLAEGLTMLVFLNYSALLPLFEAEWGLSHTEAGLIFSAYQVGYIAAVAVLSSLTDWVEPRKIYLLSAVWAGLTNLAFAAFAAGLASALLLRALVGAGLAGTYMPGMRLVAERFPPARRGFALGCYIATFTLGASASLLLTGAADAAWGWRSAFALTGLGPLLAAGAAWLLLAPNPSHGVTRRSRGGAAVWRNRSVLRLIVAYAAHNWELFGMRGWMAAFLAASLVAAGATLDGATQRAAAVSSLVLGVGAISNPIAGFVSDRWGRAPFISTVMLTSGACSFLIGWGLRWPFAGLVAVALLYGFVTTAESAVVSTSITEHAEPAALGRTMALQSTIGFTTAAVAPAGFGLVLDLTQSWGWAFALLGAGVLLGPLAIGFRERPARGR